MLKYCIKKILENPSILKEINVIKSKIIENLLERTFPLEYNEQLCYRESVAF